MPFANPLQIGECYVPGIPVQMVTLNAATMLAEPNNFTRTWASRPEKDSARVPAPPNLSKEILLALSAFVGFLVVGLLPFQTVGIAFWFVVPPSLVFAMPLGVGGITLLGLLVQAFTVPQLIGTFVTFYRAVFVACSRPRAGHERIRAFWGLTFHRTYTTICAMKESSKW